MVKSGLNVLVTAQYFPPDLGGAATRAGNLVRGLSLNGCNVTVIAAFPHYPDGRIPREYKWKLIKMEKMGEVKLIRTFMPPIKSVGLLRRLTLVAAFAISALFALPWVGHIDAVWAQSWVPGLVCGKVKRAPVALNVDDLTIEDMRGLELVGKDSIVMKLGEICYRLFYVNGDLVTPISPGYVETISRKYCVTPSRIHVVGIGVDLNTFKFHARNCNSRKKFRVLYCGVFGVGYDFGQVLEAAKIVREKGEDIEFILHGSGECLEQIRNKIRILHLPNIMLSDKILRTRLEVDTLLGDADVLILPLKDYGRPYLGIPSKLYEYQAVGKPIICCAEGQPAEYVKASSSGIVVRPGDSEGLAHAILALFHNRKLANDLGNAGRVFVEENASIERIGLKLLLVFDGILQED